MKCGWPLLPGSQTHSRCNFGAFLDVVSGRPHPALPRRPAALLLFWSGSVTVQSTTTVLPLANALAKLEGDKVGLAASLVESISIGNGTGGVLGQVVDVRPDGTILVGTAMSYNQGEPVAFSHEGVEVEVPSALLESFDGLGPVAAASWRGWKPKSKC